MRIIARRERQQPGAQHRERQQRITVFVTNQPGRIKPKLLRFRLLNITGRVVGTGRRDWLRLPRGMPWIDILIAGHYQLAALTA